MSIRVTSQRVPVLFATQKPPLCVLLIVAGLILTSGTLAVCAAEADDRYYRVSLKTVEDLAGNQVVSHEGYWPDRINLHSRVIVTGEGEAYVSPPPGTGNPAERSYIYFRVPPGEAVVGRAIVALPREIRSYSFRVPPSVLRSTPAEPRQFKAAKREWFQHLTHQSFAGGPWFAHRAQAGNRAVPQRTGSTAGGSQPIAPGTTQIYDLMTGRRAMEENLQLESSLQVTGSGRKTVLLSTLAGITLPRIDWSERVKGMVPALDPLAKFIPVDQHALFSNNISDAAELTARIREKGTVTMSLLDLRADDHQLLQRYEDQLGLTLSTLQEILANEGDSEAELALTGSDLEFQIGSDIAILLTSDRPRALASAVFAEVRAAAHAADDSRFDARRYREIAYYGFRTSDRKLSSYVCVLPGVVCLSNSPVQLERIAAVASGELPALADSPEYVFFRERYRRGHPAEQGLAILTDDTIRRWCGPRWRIAVARRAQLAAVRLKRHAANLDRASDHQPSTPKANGNEARGSSKGDIAQPLMDSLDTFADNPWDGTGPPQFLTPIVEMRMDQVSTAEAEAYANWRTDYQSLWQQPALEADRDRRRTGRTRNRPRRFDPIALRYGVSDTRLETDLSVIPLRMSSQFNDFIGITAGTQNPLSRSEGPPASVRFALAINKQSSLFGMASLYAGAFSGSLDWVGGRVEVLVADTAFWEQDFLSTLDRIDAANTSETADELPVAVLIESNHEPEIVHFLDRLKRVLPSPTDDVEWKDRRHGDMPFVEIVYSGRRVPRPQSLFLAPTTQGLLITIGETTLVHFLEKSALLSSADPRAAKKTSPAYLGDHVGLQVEEGFVARMQRWFQVPLNCYAQEICWSNLFILNQWKHQFPERDPVDFHQAYWGTRLFCPGGGEYVWNERWQTMESTVYGHPAEPRADVKALSFLSELRFANFGLTFEDDGLRAKVAIDLKGSAERLDTQLEIAP